jgi:Arc-like DNA binding dprotein
MARKRDDTIKLVLRLPPELHRRLTRAAAGNNQSLNSEMVRRLEESLSWPRLVPLVSSIRSAAYAAVEAMYIVPAASCDPGIRERLVSAADKLRQAAFPLWQFETEGGKK